MVANSKALQVSKSAFVSKMRLISGLQLEIKLDLRSSILMDLSSQVCGVTSASAGETEGVDLDSETGEPTGVLRENAVKLLQKLMSEEDSRAAKKDQLITCLGKLGSVGVVGVQGWRFSPVIYLDPAIVWTFLVSFYLRRSQQVKKLQIYLLVLLDNSQLGTIRSIINIKAIIVEVPDLDSDQCDQL